MVSEVCQWGKEERMKVKGMYGELLLWVNGDTGLGVFPSTWTLLSRVGKSGGQCNEAVGVNQFSLSGLTVEATWELCNVWPAWCGRNRYPLCILWIKMIFMRK